MWQAVLMVSGYIISILGLSMLFPAMYDIYFKNNFNSAFIPSAIITIFIGLGLFLSNRGKIDKISLTQGYLITAISWFSCGIFASLPFALYNVTPTLTDAIFESFSGISGTGATIFSNVETLPHSILLWRSMLNALGGIGIVVFAVALLPFLGIGGMQMFQRENSDFDNKFMPKFSYIAKRIIIIFVLLICSCLLTLKFLGMSWFDATNHALTAVSTGGFSTKNNSIAYFDNVWIEIALSLFMIFGALPMTFYITLWQNKDLKSFRISQVIFFLKTTCWIIFLMIIWLVFSNKYEFLQAIRYAIFNVISIITTTGFSSANYLNWGSFAIILLFFATFIGGCTGSTSGSIKAFRWEILLAYIKRSLLCATEPNRVLLLKINEKVVSDTIVTSVYIYLTAFMLTAVTGVLLLGATGIDIWLAIDTIISCITNVGPGIVEQIGPNGNFADFSSFIKYILAIIMILGRLEIITILVIFTKSFWRKNL